MLFLDSWVKSGTSFKLLINEANVLEFAEIAFNFVLYPTFSENIFQPNLITEFNDDSSVFMQ